MEIAICVVTYKRPKLLAQLLAGLSRLSLESIKDSVVRVIVIDNDPDGSAETVCREGMTRWPIVYKVEPRRGIAAARNRALEEARGTDYFVFIDDDEVPEKEWLANLLEAQTRYEADVVSGPVLPAYAPGIASWVKRGGFFEPPKHRPGELLRWCASANVLVSKAVLASGLRFNERFQLTGGEDVHFFMEVRRAGFKIVWAKNALVCERVSPERADMKWLLRRFYRGGNCYMLAEATLDPRTTTKFLRAAKGCFRIAQGTVEILGVVFKGKAQLVRSLGHICLGMGMLAGLFRFTYEPYRVVTGN